jgi:hypothetical protein
LWTCNGTGVQQWTRTGNAFRALGKCMDVSGARTANGTEVQLYDCNGTNAQAWTGQRYPTGQRRLRQVPGRDRGQFGRRCPSTDLDLHGRRQPAVDPVLVGRTTADAERVLGCARPASVLSDPGPSLAA